jgi:hypothetical protein
MSSQVVVANDMTTVFWQSGTTTKDEDSGFPNISKKPNTGYINFKACNVKQTVSFCKDDFNMVNGVNALEYCMSGKAPAHVWYMGCTSNLGYSCAYNVPVGEYPDLDKFNAHGPEISEEVDTAYEDFYDAIKNIEFPDESEVKIIAYWNTNFEGDKRIFTSTERALEQPWYNDIGSMRIVSIYNTNYDL